MGHSKYMCCFVLCFFFQYIFSRTLGIFQKLLLAIELCKHLLFLVYYSRTKWVLCDDDCALLLCVDFINMYCLCSGIRNEPWGLILRCPFGRAKGEISEFHLVELRHLILKWCSAEGLHTANGETSYFYLNGRA